MEQEIGHGLARVAEHASNRTVDPTWVEWSDRFTDSQSRADTK
jgi:hypothetical protein